jgi:monofunctional biosynthetic peptidoglycan transglycosylase
MVQIQRRLEAMRRHRPYKKLYVFVPLRRIAPDLQHAVISAEDGRFRQHHGFDWVEMQKVLEDDIKRGRLGRGGSTITQQLVKNLFLTTERSLIRKAAEFSVVPMMEALLRKDRILELYLNVIEWGSGIYGAQAAAEYYYHVPASAVNREQSARLAAIIPAPLKRKPERMNEYSEEILNRMARVGW